MDDSWIVRSVHRSPATPSAGQRLRNCLICQTWTKRCTLLGRPLVEVDEVNSAVHELAAVHVGETRFAVLPRTVIGRNGSGGTMSFFFTLPRGSFLLDLFFHQHAGDQIVGEGEADLDHAVVGEILVADQAQAADGEIVGERLGRPAM